MNRYLIKYFNLLKYKKNDYPKNPKKIFKLIQQNQNIARSVREKQQLIKLKNLVDEASEETVFYPGLYKHVEFDNVSLKTFIKSLPIISKNDVVENVEKFKNIGFKGSGFTYRTSGSTGTPLKIKISNLAQAYRVASRINFLDWWGINYEDKSVLVWSDKNQDKYKNRFLKSIRDKLRNRLFINVYQLNDKTINYYFSEIEKFKPVYLRGYKSGLHLLAILMEKHNMKFVACEVRMVIVTSEVLYLDERIYMEKIFGCKVVNEYGAAECGLFAFECPKGSMHINEESILVNTDEEDNCIITELYNNATPLINYNNSDKIIISEELCSCGNTSRIIKNIEGRIGDFALKPDGSRIHQSIFYYIMKELEQNEFERTVFKYQIIQKGNLFRFKIIPGINFNSDVTDYIFKRMREEISEEINLELKIVSEIGREKSGKFRFFIREK